MGWKISPEGDTLCGRDCQSNSILGERGPTSPRLTPSQTGVCSHVLCLWDLPRGPRLTLRALYWVILICSMRMPWAEDATSCFRSARLVTAPPGGAALLVLPTHLFTFAQRPTPIDRFLSSSWSVSLPGWYSAAPKQQQRHFFWSLSSPGLLTPCCARKVLQLPSRFRESDGAGPLALLLY